MFVLLFIVIILPTNVNAAALGMERRETPTQRNVLLINKSGRRVDLFWINRFVDPIQFQSNSDNGEGYPYGASQGINSYIGHEFEIREMPSKKTGQCQIPNDCKKGYFQVNDQEGQKITIDKNFNVIHEDDRTKALEKADAMLDTCETLARQQQSLDALQLVDAITECMEKQVNQTLSKQEEERNFQAQLRQDMAKELVPYACGDMNFSTSIEVVNRTWKFEETPGEGQQKYQMQVFHERPTSSIFRIQNFSTPEECRALQYFPSADGTYIPFTTVNDKTKQGQLVRTLANRFYELTRAALVWLDLDLDDQYLVDKQELFDIHKDTTGVTVLPTCTKDDLKDYKDDPKHKPPTTCRLPGSTHAKVPTKKFTVQPNQIATIFLFCNQNKSERLGGLHFPDAAVHINREPNLLVMAIHRYLDEPKMDGFTTEYHFCPNHDILTHSFFVNDDDDDKTTTRLLQQKENLQDTDSTSDPKTTNDEL